jgi:hypothetical protein
MGLARASKLGDAIHFFIEDTTKIFVLLAVMIYVVAFIRVGIDANRIRSYLQGRNRFVCYGLAAMLGAITPFCSCSSIPLFLGFISARIPVGIAMAFLITSPCINEAGVVMLGGSVGWQLTGVYVAMGLLAGVLGGWFFDLIGSERLLAVSVEPATGCCCSAPQGRKLTLSERLLVAKTETWDILQRIAPWVVAGIALGAALHGYVPDDFIAAYLGRRAWWTVPAAVTMGIPTYANVTSVIPIVAELLNKGLPAGTAFAFMLSTAAASVPEFIMLKNVMSGRLLVTFAAYLLTYFTICGWVLNLISK